MPREDFSIVYQGDSVQADLLKSILEGSGMQVVLEDEYLGRMYPYAHTRLAATCRTHFSLVFTADEVKQRETIG